MSRVCASAPAKEVHRSMVLLLRDAMGYAGTKDLIEAYMNSVKRLTLELVRENLAPKRLAKK